MNDIMKKSRGDKTPRRGEKSMFVRMTSALSVMALIVLLTTVFATPMKVNSSSVGTQSAQSDKNKESDQKDEKKVRNIQLTIVPVVYSRKDNGYIASTKFKVGERVIVKLSMLNTSAEPLEVATGDAYLQHRLRLVKNGQPMHYRKGVIQLLRAKDESGSNLGGPRFVTVLEPNKQTELDSIDLDRWFEKLEPGHYELTLRHRFQWKGKQVESNTVTFEVTQ
ncbi:MAG: hypothetical protein LC803_23360 [Acidobacteria bacterium]|nr:hypothetical protein [Acidobacteriota bacterium]